MSGYYSVRERVFIDRADALAFAVRLAVRRRESVEVEHVEGRLRSVVHRVVPRASGRVLDGIERALDESGVAVFDAWGMPAMPDAA